MAWTEERVARLSELWSEGLSAAQIARQLGGGVTRNAIIGKIHRLGLSGRAAPSRPGRQPKPIGPRARRRRSHASPAPALPTALARVELVEAPGLATPLTLAAHACRWPVGDPRSEAFTFCGRPARKGPYCAAHTAQAYRPGSGGPKARAALARELRRYL
jgi:GcrA cell cycle regulator